MSKKYGVWVLGLVCGLNSFSAVSFAAPVAVVQEAVVTVTEMKTLLASQEAVHGMILVGAQGANKQAFVGLMAALGLKDSLKTFKGTDAERVAAVKAIQAGLMAKVTDGMDQKVAATLGSFLKTGQTYYQAEFAMASAADKAAKGTGVTASTRANLGSTGGVAEFLKNGVAYWESEELISRETALALRNINPSVVGEGLSLADPENRICWTTLSKGEIAVLAEMLLTGSAAYQAGGYEAARDAMAKVNSEARKVSLAEGKSGACILHGPSCRFVNLGGACQGVAMTAKSAGLPEMSFAE